MGKPTNWSKKDSQTQQLLHHAYDKTYNVIKVNLGNTLEHELAKFLIAWELMKNESNILTEAYFKSGNARADVLELTTGTVYEILYTEELLKFEGKREYYPRELTIVGLNAEQVIKKHLGDLKCLK